MSKLVVVIALSAGLLAPTSAMAAKSMEQCQTLWKKADANGDSRLTENEAVPYVKAMNGANIKPKDQTMKIVDSDEFMSACQSGAFDNM
jgi:hypothetical protein